MVELDIRIPPAPGEAGGFRTVARLRVAGERWAIEGDGRLVDLDHPVPDQRTFLSTGERRRLTFDEDPEEWARNLPATLRGPGVVAVITSDTDPLPPAPPGARPRVELPDRQPADS